MATSQELIRKIQDLEAKFASNPMRISLLIAINNYEDLLARRAEKLNDKIAYEYFVKEN